MKKIILSIISIICILICLNSCQTKAEDQLSQSDVDLNDAIVQVNDYYILQQQIDPVFKEHQAEHIPYKKIVDDTVLEILVVQESKKFNISITESELDDILVEFKGMNSQIYQEALESYGEDGLREKLRIRNLFSKTKSYVIENIILKDGISHSEILRFAEKYDLTTQLAPYTDEQILNDLENEIINFLFHEWMNNLKDAADITYFDAYYNLSSH